MVSLLLYAATAGAGYYLRTRQEGPLAPLVRKLLADEDGNGKIDLLERLVARARGTQPPAAPLPPATALGR